MSALGALAMLCPAPSAGAASLEFCPLGEGAGQCAAPNRTGAQRGLAADTGNGLLYVADEGNNRVDVFASDGSFLFAFGWKVNAATPEEKLQTCTTATGCQKGTAGAGAGQFDRPVSVAVDNDPASASRHDVYVSELGEDEGVGKDDREHPRIQKFDPAGEFIWMAGKEVDKTDSGDLCTKAEVQAEGHTCGKALKSPDPGGFFSAPFLAAGPAGVLYAVDNVRPPGDTIEQRLQRFEPSGALVPPPVIILAGNLVFARAIALDAAGNLWVTGQGTGLRKYCPPSWALCAGPFESGANFATGALTTDATGNVYAGQLEGGFNTIAAFDPAGTVFRRFAYTLASGGSNLINGLAAHTSGFGEFFFSRRNGGITYTFQPLPGPVVAAPSLEVKDIGSTKATLIAEANPEGKATDVHFEYLTQEEYEGQGESFAGPATKSTPPEPLGAAGFSLKATEAPVGCLDPATEAGEPGNECLTPETTYRWRVVASNADGAGEGPVEGPPFTTNESLELGETYATRVGTDTARLNGEANPNSIPATGFFEYVDDAAYQKDTGEGGDGFAAATQAPDVGEGQAPLDFGAGEALATRSIAIYPLMPGTIYHYRLVAANPLVEPVKSEARELRTFEPPEADPSCANNASRIGPGAFLPDCRAYEMVSPLDKAGSDIRVLETTAVTPAVLEQSSVSGGRLAYGSLRSFGGAASAPFTSQYIARRIAGTAWETHPIDSPRGRPLVAAIGQFDTEFKAFSAELCEAWQVTVAEPPLAAGALAEYSNLYRRTDELCSEDGEAHYEALGPVEAPEDFPPLPPPAPTFNMSLLGVSANGEHALFTANGKLAAEGSKGQRQLYESVRGQAPRLACILPGGGAVSGSCTAGTATIGGDPGAQTGRVSNDGERVFWTAPSTGEGEIYMRSGGAQTVEVSKGGEEASGTSASWFWGAAADGSKAVFSTEAKPGSSDLYEFDTGSEETDPIAEGVVGVMGISEDANLTYFASSKVLSGEETNSNGDKAQPGKANLYLHDAGSGSTEFVATLASADLVAAVSTEPYVKRTSRVSPDGAHAAFISAAPLTGYDNKDAQSGVATEEAYRYDADASELLCVSCNPSGARPAGRSWIPSWESPMHAARALSEDGSRLYFESADALAARDSNGRVDVYQWEELGAGGCGEEDAAFSASAGGCVELLSSGQSPLDSRFVESDPSGDNAFFATGASLLPQDFGVFDIYDARAGGGLPIPPIPSPPCEGDACHAQIPPPEEPTPASSGYVAPPEVPAAGKPAKRRCAKGKRRVSAKGKSRCVPKNKRRRAAR